VISALFFDFDTDTDTDFDDMRKWDQPIILI